MTTRQEEIARHPANHLRAPWIERRTYRVLDGQFRAQVYDQPGRWMSDDELAGLYSTLIEIAQRSMDEVPEYGVFTGERSAFVHRVLGVLYEVRTGEPAGFTAMAYLPILLYGKVEPVLHLGLTMIKRRFQGHRLQGPLFEKLFYLPSLNQMRLGFYLTSIAASPAGIGSIADYFEECYPDYRGEVERKGYHLTIAETLLRDYRAEFGCSENAVFDPETFVVIGSNEPRGGGAHQFIREDAVSRHRSERCNRFCEERLRYPRGDEIFQVARLNLLRGIWGVMRRRGQRRLAAGQAQQPGFDAPSGSTQSPRPSLSSSTPFPQSSSGQAPSYQ